MKWIDTVYSNGTWVENSFTFENAALTGGDFIIVAYFIIAFFFAVLIHSFMINRLKYPIVRIATDIACISLIIQTFALLQCSSHCTQIQSVVWVNIIANGIFSAIVQGCDNYITFARYAGRLFCSVFSTFDW